MFKIYTIIFYLFFFNLAAEIVKKFELNGNDRISKETVGVYGDIDIGKNYSAFELNEMLKKLYGTNFFEDVKIDLNNGLLSIRVKEYPSINSIDIIGEKNNTRKKEVLEKLTLQAKESFIENNLTQDINILKKIYAYLGYNFASVEAKIQRFDENRINLVFVLDKGKKTNISKINFIGDKKIKNKRLRDIIVSEEKKFWKILSKNTFLSNNNLELDVRLLTNYYKSIGYYDVQVLSSNAEVSKDNSTTLTYTISAGTRYKINKISTNIADVLDKKAFLGLQDEYKETIGKYYSPFLVKKLLDELDLLIVNNDLQFVEHSVNEILSDDNIEIKINIYEGQKKLVERINILGNTVTNESVIRSELLLDEGDPFNNLKIEQSIAKIKSRNIFAKVKKKIIDGSNEDQKIIDIEVEEKPTGEISAGAGIGTNGGSFAFNITENNWLGKGIAVSTNLDVSKETFSGALEVNQPNYNFSGNSLNYFVSNTSNDKPDSGYKNNIVSTGIGTRFEQYRDIFLSPQISLSYDDLKVKDTASEALKKQKGTFTDVSLDYAISLDKRNNVYAPTDGYISTFRQGVPIYADSPYLKNTYAFSKYYSPSQDAVVAFKFYGSAINGLNNKDVRPSKRLSIPTSRLRGFEAGKVGPKDGIDYVGGNYSAATNLEVALPNFLPESTKTDVGLFLDVGNIWHVDYDKNMDDSNKLRSSVGVNTAWSSPVGPMTFIFSQNISKASTDVTESFNFRLGTTF
ncbi:MAG: outer membrane protein assembly factor BamA [Pelagibacteraceae bacterium]|nr:outer membrane protein assembly factor BamA [Pelagibacteraceae bacterium]